MLFKGISRKFLLTDEKQYDTIGCFWDEMTSIYGLENLYGLGYKWYNNEIYYAIGLKNKDIDNYDFIMELPDDGWKCVIGLTDELKNIYDEIYLDGSLKYEIEMFFNDGKCKIYYLR